MARTAPAPNIPPIPGMCPSLAVLAGGGDGGGGSGGSAGDGNGDNNAGANKGGENAEADKRGAPDYEKYPECGYASHPVDVVTGRAFTHPITDIDLEGPLPLEFNRMYSSKMADRDAGLGFGWGHTFGWEVEVRRRSIVVWNEQGIAVDFPMIQQGDEVIGPWGWVLRRETWGFAVDADDGLWHLFSASEDEGKRWRLTAIEDRNRNRIALTYEDGKLVEVKDSAGRTLRVVPTREGRVASFQVLDAPSPGQRVTLASYTYDERGNLASATDGDGFSAHYEYDDDHRLTSDTDRTGLCFHFVYDREGRCVESWGDYPGRRDPSLVETLPRFLHDGVTRAKGIHHCKFDYDVGGATEVVDSVQVRTFFGTKHGTLAKAVEGGGVMTATYRDDGHLMSRTDALGGTTHFERDVRGRVLQVTDALGRTTVIDRDANGLAVQIVDAAGGIMIVDRDRFGNILRLTEPAGHTTAYAYDTRGLVTEIQHPNGGRTSFTYDAHGNVATVTMPNGGVQRFEYDGLGQVVREIDALGAETAYAYSTRGDLVTVRDGVGSVTRYTYDGEGHCTEVVWPSGQRTGMVWGGYNALAEQRNPDGTVMRFLHDLEGDLVQVIDERGGVYRFEHDPSGKIVGETRPDGRAVRYRRDADDRVVVMTDGTSKTTLTYDLEGQLVERELADGTKETFEYDARGDLVAATGATCAIRLERDSGGRVVRESQQVGSETIEVETRYDGMDEVVERRSSLGYAEVIERDLVGARLRTRIGDKVIEHAPDLLGREILRRFGGGGAIETAFDAEGQILRRRALGRAGRRAVGAGEPEWLGARDDGTTFESSFTYDVDGEIVAASHSTRGSMRYEYDAIGRLLSAQGERGRGEAYRYDALGNIFEAGGPQREYDRGARLVRSGQADLAWDDQDQLTEKRVRLPSGEEAVTRYTWDAAGTLRKVEQPDGVVVDFAYDPLGRRMQKRVSRPPRPGAPAVAQELTRFVWDGQVLLHAVRRVIGAEDETTTYLFEDDSHEPFAHVRGRGGDGTIVHYVNDAAGAPDATVHESGALAARIERGVWGSIEQSGDDAGRTPLRLQGQYEDEEIGLCYHHMRYFDPSVGRFISGDPLGLEAGTNPFAYPGNPLSFIDPLGLDWNYRLRNKSGKVYYVGRASDKDSAKGVARRHAKTKGKDGVRFGKGDTLERITDPKTGYATTRGIEQAGIKDYKTAIGRRKCNGNKVRGNNIKGVDPNNQSAKDYKGAATKYMKGKGVKSVRGLRAKEKVKGK